MSAVTKDSVRILGTKLQVVQGDLTTFQADCIVNAANEPLDHHDGLAKAIVDAGAVQTRCYGHLGDRTKVTRIALFLYVINVSKSRKRNRATILLATW